MSRESILKIKEAEDTALHTVEDAKRRAREMIEQAELEGKALCERTEREATAEYTAMLEQIRERCARLSDKSTAETDEEIAALRREVNLRRKIAEKIIVRGVESKCR